MAAIEQWIPMPKGEAEEWCKRWEIETDLEYKNLQKWNPKVELGNPEVEPFVSKAIELVWEDIKSLRAPCARDGFPALIFQSSPSINSGLGYTGLDTASIVKLYGFVHSPHMPSLVKVMNYPRRGEADRLYSSGEIRLMDQDLEFAMKMNRPEVYFAQLIMGKLDFVPSEPQFCENDFWTVELKEGDKRQRCPKCGLPGSGFGVVGNQRRFFHEKYRSCYVGSINPRKLNPLVRCPKCGEQGRESLGKDGFMRIRHANKVCYVGKKKDATQ